MPATDPPAGASSPSDDRLSSGIARSIAIVLGGLSLLALLAPFVGPEAVALVDRVDVRQAYFPTFRPLLLYVGLPLAVLGSLVAVLAPGLLLALALGGCTSTSVWVLQGFALSLVATSLPVALVQAAAGRPVLGLEFAAILLATTVAAAALLLGRVGSGKELRYPAGDLPRALPLLGVPLVFLIALLPKFLWESFNGDGAHAYEASRLLLHRALPFWPEGAGNVANFPGLNSALFTWPNSWFLRLFGECEAGVRLPFLLLLLVIVAAVIAVVEHGRPKLGTVGHALIWMGLCSYGLVMAYSATYDPYCSDIGLPATQDTLVMICFLGVVHGFLARATLWTAVWALFTLMSSPAGPMLLAAWFAGVVIGYRKRPWGRIVLYLGTVAGCVVLTAVIPKALAILGLPTPGGEHDAGALLKKFWFLLATDYQRWLYLILPCGIYPVLCLLSWRKADEPARALMAVTALVFGMYYVIVYVSLHYFVPAMILPLVAFWRIHRARDWSVAPVAACFVAATVSLVLGLPKGTGIYTGTRQVGATMDVTAFGGYARMEPEPFRAIMLLEELFVDGWLPEVPDEAYAGAALSWNYYAHAAGDGIPKTYRLAPAGGGAPGIDPVADNEVAELFVLDPDRWQEHRTLQPIGSQGRGVYAVPRDMLFRRPPVRERFPCPRRPQNPKEDGPVWSLSPLVPSPPPRSMENRQTNITVQFHQEYFRTRFVYDPRRDGIWREVAQYIQKLYIAPDARILDLGAGYCDFINHVKGSERYAVDIFEGLHEYAREGVEARIGRCTDLSFFEDDALDVVFASNLFEHLTHDELLETINEIRRVLVPKGRLILLQPNFKYCYRTYFDDYTHLQIFTHEGMYDLLEMAGLRIERMHARFLPVNMKSTLKLHLPFLPLLVRTYLRLPYKPLAAQMLAVAQNHPPA